MASYKGKYKGPDVFKGDQKKIDAWKAAGKPALKKKNTLQRQARDLGASKFAPFLEAINQQRAANRSMYDTATQERVSALDRELGSIQASGSTAQKTLADLKTSTGNEYQQAIAQSQQNSAAVQAARNQANSNMLSSLEAEAKARGLSSGTGGAYAEAATQLGSQDSAMAMMAMMNQGSLESMKAITEQGLTSAQAMSGMLDTTAKSQARGQAQGSLDDLFRTYLSERNSLAGTEATTQLEKQDYINQTYLTLKEKKAAEKAAEAQALLQQQIAQGELNYKNTKLQVDTQYKYDKLAQDKALKEIANQLKAQGFSAKQAKDQAELLLKNKKFQLDSEKWNWKKANPDSAANMSISDFIASIR